MGEGLKRAFAAARKTQARGGFKIKCRFVYPWLESGKTFSTRRAAAAELKALQIAASAQNQQLVGSVVAVNADRQSRSHRKKAFVSDILNLKVA